MTNIEIYRGDDITWEITLEDSSALPVDVSAWTFAGMVRLAPDGVVAATWSFDLTNASDGVIVASIPRSDTATLSPGLYGFDLEYVDANNKKSTFLAGRLIVQADYTHGG